MSGGARGQPSGARVSAGVAVAGACAAFFAFAVISSALRSSATYDEVTHLPAGYSYLATGDFRMNPEHPPLVKMLAALPVWISGRWPARLELTDGDLRPGAGNASLLAARQAWELGLTSVDVQWLFGHHLLYGVTDEALRRLGIFDPSRVPSTARLGPGDFATDADHVLMLGRMPIMLIGFLLAALVLVWARELHGIAGGLVALAFYCFDPNFIAHSALVTTDVAASAFIFGAVYFLWRTCRRADVASVALLLLFSALAFAAKFSAAILAPIVALLGLGRVLAPDGWPVGRGSRLLRGRREKAALLAALAAGIAVASFVTVWAMYGFRYSAARDPAAAAAGELRALAGAPSGPPGRVPGHPPIEWMVRRSAAVEALVGRGSDTPPESEVERTMASAPLTATGAAVLAAERLHLLPEAYLYGLAFAEMKSHVRASFLRGRYSPRGFRTFFLWSFILKTPLVTLAAIAAAVVLALRRRDPRSSELAFLLVPAGLYAIASVVSGINIGHRHLLPIYPFLFVLCGSLAREARRPPWALLPAIAVGSSLVFSPPWKPQAVYPHYLAYFNELAGGPRRGYLSMVDSNLDWGQDLKSLGDWLAARGIREPINLCYFGMADPRYYGIAHVNLPGGYVFEPMEPFASARIPGYLAISATNLQGAYMSSEERDGWRRLLASARLVDAVGHSIFVYALGG